MDYHGHPDQYFGCTTYSQHGEDLMIANIFKLLEIKYPSYVDIGAHHPLHISNTALLYKRGSRGICVEANPNLINSFKSLRSEDTIVNVGVGPFHGVKPFYMYDLKSGLNSLSPEHLPKIEHTIDVPVITINRLFEEHCKGKPVDFMSIDIEGVDMAVLDSLNYRAFGPKVICTEARRDEGMGFCNMMYDKGYKSYCRMGENVIFVQYEYFSKLF